MEFIEQDTLFLPSKKFIFVDDMLSWGSLDLMPVKPVRISMDLEIVQHFEHRSLMMTQISSFQTAMRGK